MKKLVSLLLAIVLLCSALVGCDFSIIDNWMSNTSTTTLTSTNEPEIQWEEKVYWEGDINENFVPGEVLVVLDKAISELNKVHSKEFFVGVEIEKINDLTYRSDSIPHDVGNDFHQILSLTLFEKTKEAVVSAIKIIELIPGVKGAQPNYIYEISSTTPNDPLYSFANNCDDQWGLEKINVEKVWDFTTGSCDVRVGVIDTGISLHNDLKNNYYFINGVEDYSNALDFFSSNNDTPVINVQDNHLHGTHVAGIIGAEGNNEEGISGVVWNVSLVQMRIGNYSFDTNSIVNALKWATSVWDTNARIDIINFSGEGANPDLSFEIAIRDYCNKGGLFVCCAGNDPQDNDLSGTRVYPSFYGSPLYGDNYIPNIITVGNSDETDSRAEGANWGLNSIDIYAPGTCILSTIPTELCGSTISECNLPVGHYRYGYHHISGSSMSTPHVSGVAALLLSVNPNLTAAQIENCIMNGADSITITTGDGANQLVKRLNAWGAFKYLMDNYYECKYTNIGYADKTVSYFVDGDGDYFDEHTYLQKIRVVDTGEYTFTISANAPIEVKIYDKYFNEIVISQNVFENGNKIEFSCLFSLEFEDYYIKAKFIDNSSEGNVNIYIDSPLHTHNFTKWVEYSPTQHIEHCECGLKGTVKANHVVKSSDTSKCMLCGAKIDLVGGFGESFIQNIQKVTLNGSYILPNGIIVLVDEDVEAYFNGTLVFYDKDKLPQTQ